MAAAHEGKTVKGLLIEPTEARLQELNEGEFSRRGKGSSKGVPGRIIQGDVSGCSRGY
jgi:hypothetical protein